jgi:predicted RNase H-like HicB family nuclease
MSMAKFLNVNKFNESMLSLTAIIQKDKNMYVAKCPEIGTVSQGHSVEDALANLKEATQLYLEEFPLKERKQTLLTTFEVAENVKT